MNSLADPVLSYLTLATFLDHEIILCEWWYEVKHSLVKDIYLLTSLNIDLLHIQNILTP